MKIEEVELVEVSLRLVEPFETSFGVQAERRAILVRASAGGTSGWGECCAARAPLYSSETTGTARHVLAEFFVPAVLGREIDHPSDTPRLLRPWRGHPMAKAALEAAAWDLWCRLQGVPLWRAFGGARGTVDAGVSVGVQPSVEALLDRVARYLADGYRRVKIKVRPGWDEEPLSALRRRFPDLPLWADANGAYTLADADRLARLDARGLGLLEQPLAPGDLVDHAALAGRISTPICLDESILSAEDVRRALAIGACRVVNVKWGRVGGATEALAALSLCAARGVPAWCGGMLETNVGRGHALAVATHPGATLPADLSASDRYYLDDPFGPPFRLGPGGRIALRDSPGCGVDPDFAALDRVTVWREVFRT